MTEEQKKRNADRARERYANDPEYRARTLATARKWRENNPDKVRRNAKLSNMRHSEKRKAERSTPEFKAGNLMRQRRFHALNPWYNSFQLAKQRCENPRNPMYKRYGAKGIKFMLSKFDAKFLWQRDQAHLLECASIDRIDNNGHYSLENCRFIEKEDNSRKTAIDAVRRRNNGDAPAREWDRLTKTDGIRENEYIAPIE